MVVQVTTPATSLALVTLDELKTRLEISESTSDALLTSLVLEASLAAARHCHRTLVSETVRETLRPRSRETFLNLDRYPVTNVASVTESGAVLTATDYELDPRPGILARLDGDDYGHWERPAVIQYTGGFTDIPADLKGAVIEIALSSWHGRDRDPLVKREAVPDVGSVEYTTGDAAASGRTALPVTAVSKLRPYVRLTV